MQVYISVQKKWCFFLLWSNEIFKYTWVIMCHDEQAKLTLHYLNFCCQICRYNFCVHLHLLRRWGCAEAPLTRSCLRFVFPWKWDSCKATPAKSRNKNIHSFIQFLPLIQFRVKGDNNSFKVWFCSTVLLLKGRKLVWTSEVGLSCLWASVCVWLTAAEKLPECWCYTVTRDVNPIYKVFISGILIQSRVFVSSLH